MSMKPGVAMLQAVMPLRTSIIWEFEVDHPESTFLAELVEVELYASYEKRFLKLI